MSREVDALEAQCEELLALVAEFAPEDWDRPTRCDGWGVKELVAHVENMAVRLVGANAEAVDGPPEIDRVGYYAYDPHGPREGEDPGKTFSEVVRDRVIDEVGGRTGDQLRAALERSLGEMLRALDVIPPDRVIKRSGHAKIAFGEFVATRVLEFGVHSMDIGHATLRGERIHPDAAQLVKEILDARLGVALPKGMGWDSRTYILTGTGRRRLEPNEAFVLGPLAAKFPLLS